MRDYMIGRARNQRWGIAEVSGIKCSAGNAADRGRGQKGGRYRSAAVAHFNDDLPSRTIAIGQVQVHAGEYPTHGWLK